MASGIGDQLRKELLAMVSYALASGSEVSPLVLATAISSESKATLDEQGMSAVVRAHRQVRESISPATPGAIVLFEQEQSSSRPWLPDMGPVRLVRQLSALALIFIALFIALALSPDVNRQSGGILDSQGWPLLENLLFVLSAAGLGAVFSSMFRAMRYVKERTYDPSLEATYWIQIVLGLIAGLLLAELVVDVLSSEAAESTNSFPVGRPLLALLGGFSAGAVFRMLQRIVDAVESIFKGDARELLNAELRQAQTFAAQQVADARLSLSATLIRLNQQIESGAPTEELAKQVRAMLDDMLPLDGAAAHWEETTTPENRSKPPEQLDN